MPVETTFDKLSRELLEIAKEKYPKRVKSFMKKAGNKLKKQTVFKAERVVKRKTGNYMEGFKAGKPYRYQGTDDCIRVYNGAPHAHLIEYGHKQTDKAGNDLGFTPGKHILENAGREYEDEFYDDIENFIDDMLSDSGLA